MEYARIVGETVTVGAPPRLFFDGVRWWDWRDPAVRVPETFAPHGWFPIVETARPPDTATTTYDYSVTIVNGLPTETWTERAKTQEELDRATQASNLAVINNKIGTVDMPAMQAILDDVNSNINSNPAARIKDIAKAVRRLDRKVQGLLDGTE